MSLLKKYDTIIFDFGQVIVDLNYELCIANFMKWATDEQKVKTLLSYTDFHKEYEKGACSSEEFIQLANAYLETDIPEDEFRAAWNSMVGEMPKRRMDFLVQLKQSKQVLLLSNTNQIHEDYFEGRIRKEFEVSGMNHFVHHPIYSHRIGLRKPNADIYEYVITNHLVDPAKALFLDDKLENVEASIASGIAAIQVKHPDQIFEILK